MPVADETRTLLVLIPRLRGISSKAEADRLLAEINPIAEPRGFQVHYQVNGKMITIVCGPGHRIPRGVTFVTDVILFENETGDLEVIKDRTGSVTVEALVSLNRRIKRLRKQQKQKTPKPRKSVYDRISGKDWI
jgi:hypothetical protein